KGSGGEIFAIVDATNGAVWFT
ncbi:hypothetical protein A2U01_0049108, partial [Trifolium medium]|nr:hypothetical protein [Trifolium medium]